MSAAYLLLDDTQKKKLRKKKQRKRKQKQKKAKRKYGIEAEISDLESFLMLDEKQKQSYAKQKSDAKVA